MEQCYQLHVGNIHHVVPQPNSDLGSEAETTRVHVSVLPIAATKAELCLSDHLPIALATSL